MVLSFLQMSVISSHVSGISSILKSGVRAQFIPNKQKKISFELPKDVKSVIADYETGCNTHSYEEMICVLRDSEVKV